MTPRRRAVPKLLPWVPLSLLCILFPLIFTTLRLDLLRFTGRLLRGTSEFRIPEAFVPRGGEGILPAGVRPLIARLRDAGVRDCSIAPNLKLPSEAYQRLLEGAYPVIFREGSCCRIEPSPSSRLAEVALDGCL